MLNETPSSMNGCDTRIGDNPSIMPISKSIKKLTIINIWLLCIDLFVDTKTTHFQDILYYICVIFSILLSFLQKSANSPRSIRGMDSTHVVA